MVFRGMEQTKQLMPLGEVVFQTLVRSVPADGVQAGTYKELLSVKLR